MSITIQELINQSHSTACEKGWWQDLDRSFGEQLMLMVTELAEIMEDFRVGGLTDPENMIYFGDKKKPCGIAVEFADLFIRAADTCGRYGIPLEEALCLKLEYNKTRPYRHGDKLA